jgi:hypothetical protein
MCWLANLVDLLYLRREMGTGRPRIRLGEGSRRQCRDDNGADRNSSHYPGLTTQVPASHRGPWGVRLPVLTIVHNCLHQMSRAPNAKGENLGLTWVTRRISSSPPTMAGTVRWPGGARQPVRTSPAALTAEESRRRGFLQPLERCPQHLASVRVREHRRRGGCQRGHHETD